MKVWIDSLSVKNSVIAVLMLLLVLQFGLFMYLAVGVVNKLENQEVRLVPPELAGTLNIPLKSKREKALLALSGYIAMHAENYAAKTLDSFFVPAILYVAPEYYTTLRTYFSGIAAFANKYHIVSNTQIDPATETFEIDGDKGVYKALGVTQFSSSLTNNPIAHELREYTMTWRISDGYAGITDYKYVVLDSTLPERKEAGKKQLKEQAVKKAEKEVEEAK